MLASLLLDAMDSQGVLIIHVVFIFFVIKCNTSQYSLKLCNTFFFLLIHPWKIWIKFHISNFQANLSHWWLRYLVWNRLRWVLKYLNDDKSTMVQVMAGCHQATSHYLTWVSDDLDLCHHLASLGHNELKWLPYLKGYKSTLIYLWFIVLMCIYYYMVMLCYAECDLYETWKVMFKKVCPVDMSTRQILFQSHIWFGYERQHCE